MRALVVDDEPLARRRLIRMLNWPARSPLSLSRRLPGGIRRSLTPWALFSIRSFLLAGSWISRGSLRDTSPRQILSVSRDRKDLITALL